MERDASMNDRIKQQLVKFLDKRLKKFFYDTKGTHDELDIHYIKTVKGFENSMTQKADLGFDSFYKFCNGNGHQCNLGYHSILGFKNERLISITIDTISSGFWRGTIGMLYRCMDEINEIAEEFRKLRGDLEKQEKINEITKNSIYTWLKTVLENQPYSYYTTEDESKITLSIKMKNRMQLDIPIYYKEKMLKIIPELPEIIQQFAKTVKKSKFKVLISNSQPDPQWTTQERKK
jgi:hypothetical protein